MVIVTMGMPAYNQPWILFNFYIFIWSLSKACRTVHQTISTKTDTLHYGAPTKGTWRSYGNNVHTDRLCHYLSHNKKIYKIKLLSLPNPPLEKWLIDFAIFERTYSKTLV